MFNGIPADRVALETEQPPSGKENGWNVLFMAVSRERGKAIFC
jgi:hypothetical protein